MELPSHIIGHILLFKKKIKLKNIVKYLVELFLATKEDKRISKNPYFSNALTIIT